MCVMPISELPDYTQLCCICVKVVVFTVVSVVSLIINYLECCKNIEKCCKNLKAVVNYYIVQKNCCYLF